MPRTTKPKLPPLLERKLSKTGQTRGADDDVIFQNRVSRSNTVLIPFHQWQANPELRDTSNQFECGYIGGVLEERLCIGFLPISK